MPNNECIDGKGISPDIEVKLSKKDIEQLKKEFKEMEEHPEKTEEIRKEREKRIDSQMKRAIEVIKEYRLIERILSGKKAA
jgi:carboxyl-terminal processing protease